MIPEYLYRFEDSMDAFGVKVHPRKFKVIKETPCGYWIELFYWGDDKKWVSKVARKRYAYPTKHEALTSFKARKKRQIEILEAQLNQARQSLRWTEPFAG